MCTDRTVDVFSKRQKRHLLLMMLAVASGCQTPTTGVLNATGQPASNTALAPVETIDRTSDTEHAPTSIGQGKVAPVGFNVPVIPAPQQDVREQRTSPEGGAASEGNEPAEASEPDSESASTFEDFLLQGSGQSSAVEAVPMPQPETAEAGILDVEIPQPEILTPETLDAETHAGLTLAELERAAASSHPALAEARADIEAARGQFVQVGLPFNPVLQYRSEEIGNEGASGVHKVNVAQTFITANKLELARQVQAQQIEKRLAELRFAELQILTRVRTMFARTLVAQRRAELTAQIVDIAEKSLESVEALLRAQEVSRIELLQARVEVEQARIEAENAVTQLESNRRGLAAAAGVPQLPPAPLMGDLEAGLTDAPWETLIARINAASPEVAANNSELQRARSALQLAFAQVVPNIIGEVGVGVDTASDDTFGIVGISVPLPIRNRNQGNIRTARANIAAAAAAIDSTQFSLEARLAEVLARYRMARERYQRLQETVVPDAEETLELSRTAFNAGETSFLQLLTAQRTLFATRLSVLDSVVQAREALAEIEGVLVTLSDSPGDAVRTPQSLGTGGGMGQGRVGRAFTRRN